MMRIFFSCLAALLLGHVVAAQPLPKALLWKVSGHGITYPCYLFATLHPVCRDEATLPPRLLAALDSVQTIYLEFRQDSAGFKNTLRQVAKLHGEKFRDLFTHEEYQDIRKVFGDRLHLPLGLLQHYNPFTYWNLVTPHLTGCHHTVNLEDLLTILAHDRHLQLRGLETVQDVFQAIDSLPPAVMPALLLEYARNWDTLLLRYQQLKTAYYTQDLEQLQTVSRLPPQSATTAAVDQVLLYDRSRRWMPRIRQALAEGPVLIACGASHLTGPDGLIAMLQRDGYTLTPQP